MSLSYEKVYEVYNRLPPYFTFDIANLGVTLFITSRFQPKYYAELEDFHRQKYPRRKKIKLENLTPDEVEPIRQKWQRRALAMVDTRIKQAKKLNEILNTLAPSVDIEFLPEMQPVRKVSIYEYHTQGYGAERYARSSLVPDEQMLIRAGADASIQLDDNYFILYANIEHWQFDAIKRRSKMTTLEWAVLCWKNGVNPKVYNPFLPDDVFDKSMSIHMGKKNCEPAAGLVSGEGQ